MPAFLTRGSPRLALLRLEPEDARRRQCGENNQSVHTNYVGILSGLFAAEECTAQSVIERIVAGEFPSRRLLMKTNAGRPSTIAISISSRKAPRTGSLMS